MKVDVVMLPMHLAPGQLEGRTVVVFDVLRATTTMTAALAAGVREIRVFGTLAEARAAAEGFEGPRVLCGEERCLRPPGFDLGNSPGAFAPAAHAGATVFMSTTNGTRAILAAGAGAAVFVAALVNAGRAAAVAAAEGRDVVLLCSGTGGAVAMEDVIGAGAVVAGLMQRGFACGSDVAAIALGAFERARDDLPAALRQTRGGQNVVAAGLTPDIDFAARHDVLEAVGRVCDSSNSSAVVVAV